LREKNLFHRNKEKTKRTVCLSKANHSQHSPSSTIKKPFFAQGSSFRDRTTRVLLNCTKLISLNFSSNTFISFKLETALVQSFQTQVLYILEDQDQDPPKTLRKTLLYNKERHIQTIIHEDKRDLRPQIRAFKCLQSLKFLSDYFFTSYLAEAKKLLYLKKFCQSIKGLCKLQHLHLQIDSFSSLGMISTLNSCKRLLKALTTLKIRIMWDPWEYDDDVRFFGALLKNKNILKSTTHLHPNCIEMTSAFQLFKEILASCPKLVSLRLETRLQNPKEIPPENCVSVDSQYLRTLTYLDSLEIFYSSS